MELPWLKTSLVILRIKFCATDSSSPFVIVPPDMYVINNNTSNRETILTMLQHSDSSILSYE